MSYEWQALADRISGGDQSAIPEAIAAISNSSLVRILRTELAARGLTLEQVLDVRRTVSAAEASAVGGRLSEAAREAIRLLYAAHFDETQIGQILELDPARVSDHIRLLSSKTQEVVRLHHAGKTPDEIARQVSLTLQGVHYLLSQAGIRPHRKYRRLTKEQKESILELWSLGRTQGEIAETLGINVYDVKNTVRLARKHIGL